MLSLQELSDRFEIQDLIARYSQLLDRRAWDEMDALFTEDCVLDYTSTGAIKGTWPEHKAFDIEVLTPFKGTQHLMGLPIINLSGDTATARTICFNPMVIDDKKLFYVGLWYDDELVRTKSGWRFAKRTEELSFFDRL
ncbi:MAG: nuclear transport factor 2 family protein [Mycobacteriales bacterium]